MLKSNLIKLCKKDLLEIYEAALDSVQPDKLVRRVLRFEKDSLILSDETANKLDNLVIDVKNTNIHVIGGGKSVLKLATGLARVARQFKLSSDTFNNGSISVPLGLKSSFEKDDECKDLLKFINTKINYCSENNIPDKASVKASESILESISKAVSQDQTQERRSLFIVLLSGGGSACLSSPRYINLDSKLSIINFLVQKGASIVELNTVRRYFSNIKGGGLASYILRNNPNSRILSMIISDVIGNPIEFIASGPTFLEKEVQNHKESMLSILKKYSYKDLDAFESKCVENEKDPLPQEQSYNNIFNQIIGSNSIALEAAIRKATDLGYNVNCLGDDLQGFSEQIVNQITSANQGNFSDNGKTLTIGGGEAVIKRCPGESWGKGGRAQEMALDYIISKIESNSRTNFIDIFLSGTTDGQDGPTDVAGCMVSYSEWSDESNFTLDDARKAKREHNSNLFWESYFPSWLIKTGLSGTNVMDLYMYLTRQDSSLTENNSDQA